MNLFFTELDSYIYVYILHCLWLMYSVGNSARDISWRLSD